MVTSASVEVENFFKELKCVTTTARSSEWDNEYMK
jgi:hypothetical protein